MLEKLSKGSTGTQLYKAECLHTKRLYAVRLVELPVKKLHSIRQLYKKLADIPCAQILPLVDSFVTWLPLKLSRELIEDREGAQIFTANDLGASPQHAVISPISGISENAALSDVQHEKGICLIFPFCGNGSAHKISNPSHSFAADILRQVTHTLRLVHGTGLSHGSLGARSIVFDGNLRAWLTGFEKQLCEPVLTNTARCRALDDLIENCGSLTFYDNAAIVDEMSPPEAGDAEGFSPALDVWSLGSLAYRLFAGRSWLEALSLTERRQLFLSQTAPKLTGDAYPIEIKYLIVCCCNSTPQKRMTAQEILSSGLIPLECTMRNVFQRDSYCIRANRSAGAKNRSKSFHSPFPRRSASERSKSTCSNHENEIAINVDVFMDKADSIDSSRSAKPSPRGPPPTIVNAIDALFKVEKSAARYFSCEAPPYPSFNRYSIRAVVEAIHKVRPGFAEELREALYRMHVDRGYAR